MSAHYKPRANVRFHRGITQEDRTLAAVTVNALCENYQRRIVAMILGIPVLYVSTTKCMTKNTYRSGYLTPEHIIRHILAWKAQLEAVVPSLEAAE